MLRFDQLRISTTLANAGLESYSDGSKGESSIRVSAGSGLSLSATGVDVDGSQSTFKTPTRVRTTANVADLAAGAPDPVDGVSLAVGDRVLVVDQSTPAQDGLYVVDTVGTGVNGVWSRTADAPTGGEAAGWYIQVLEGSTYADILYRVDADLGGATIGTDGWTMVEIGSTTASALAGAGLVVNGAALDVNVGTGIEINTDAVRLATQGNGIGGGGGSTLSVTGGTAGADVVAVTVSASGVGFDVAAIDGAGLLADGSGSLDVVVGGGIEINTNTVRLAAQGNGIAGGAGSTLSIATNSTVSFSSETWTHSNGGLAVAGSTFTTTQVPNADWVLSQVTAGVAWKFSVLATEQLDSSGDAVRQAQALYFDAAAVATDNIVISDGTTTETWVGVAGVAAANEFSIDTGADEIMDSLALRISADSTLWDAVVATALNSINNGSGTSTAGRVLIVYRTVQAAAKDDRVYSTVYATPANVQVLSYNGLDSYSAGVAGNIATSDTAQKDFGPGTITANLVAGEAHVVLNGDSQYVWDADGASWTQISGTGSIIAGTGLTKSGNTIHVGDGVVEARGGINFTADDIAVAVATAGAGTGGLVVTSGSLEILEDTTGGANLASIIDLNSNGLAIRVDDSSIEDDGNGATAQLRVKTLGIATGMLAANAVTIAKTDIQFREEEFAASSFTNLNPSTVDLASAAILGTQSDYYAEVYRNGLADLTNTGNGGTPSGATEFKIDNSGAGSTGRVTIGANISASSNTYRVKYLSTAV